MSEKKGKMVNGSVSQEFDLDYENIDVADIMAQIKKKAEALPEDVSSPGADEKKQSGLPQGDQNVTGEEMPSPSGKKALLLKLMNPFSPVIKLLIFPVYQEFRQSVLLLDRTNKRLDDLSSFLNSALDEVKSSLDRFNTGTNQRVDLAMEDLTRAKEYAKLLHNLAHNTVVEMTKLKIEQENIKSGIRILEKDFENLKNREKALESKVVQ